MQAPHTPTPAPPLSLLPSLIVSLDQMHDRLCKYLV